MSISYPLFSFFPGKFDQGPYVLPVLRGRATGLLMPTLGALGIGIGITWIRVQQSPVAVEGIFTIEFIHFRVRMESF